jgi:exonuclease VII large subunit
MRIITVAVILTATTSLAACGTSSTVTSAPSSELTASDPSQSQEPQATKAANSPADSASAERRLPNVVGMNLQAAQDKMQAAGFWFLDDQDSTGQHRLQIFDRNWVVTRQVPAAGQKVPVETKVVLWAKKYGE